MRKILIVLAVTVAILATGCPLKDKYLEMRVEYIAFRDTVKAGCASEEVRASACTILGKADVYLTNLDTKARQADASRKEIKAALEDLESVIELQKNALLGNDITPE